MLSGQLDVRGLSDAMGVPEHEVSHCLYGGREPLLVDVGGTIGEAEPLTSRPGCRPFIPNVSGTDELLTQAEVARELGLTQASVCNLVKKGRLATEWENGRRYIRRVTLEAFRAVRFPNKPAELMTVDQAMRALGLKNRQSVYRLLRENNVNPQKFGGQLYLRRDELDTLQRNRKGRGQQRATQVQHNDAVPAAVSTTQRTPAVPAATTTQVQPSAPAAHPDHPERPVYAGPSGPMVLFRSYQQAVRTVPDSTSPTGFTVKRGTPVCGDDVSDLHMLAFKTSVQGLARRLPNATPEAINARAANGETPLHYAARRGNHNSMALLLAHGADVHAVDEFGLTALHHGAERRHRDVVLLLLAYGARPDQTSDDGQTAMDVARGEGVRAVLQAARVEG
ncbi:ankyrin repeat domain-containing protein [Burkholderia pseudomallei]|uniref:ankyrin repeat domain-containing protein n=1 Tax=Burkholderia pseudomallei TaxID=28450 RepID=UPI000F1CE67E|nr:ankyrin repeat domain-containing protein [Burkholderia pseudomallei]VBG63453.1 ankyrin repeat-containing protein [Burkholderia pseudomallei]